MQRRSNAVSGWVSFPANDPAWKNTNEGGMVVKLVVCDNREFDDQFGMCCGASVTDIMSESFVGDDRRPKPCHPRIMTPSKPCRRNRTLSTLGVRTTFHGRMMTPLPA